MTALLSLNNQYNSSMIYCRARASMVFAIFCALFVVQIIAMPCCWDRDLAQQSPSNTKKHHHVIDGANPSKPAPHQHQANDDACPALHIITLGAVILALMGAVFPAKSLVIGGIIKRKPLISPHLLINFFSVTPVAPPWVR